MKRDVTFPNAQGHQLAGALDLPPGRIRAVALFAHCFTCTAQSHAARRVSLALAEQGQVVRHQANGLWGIARVRAAAGAVSQAAELHQRALAMRHRIGDRLGVVD